MSVWAPFGPIWALEPIWALGPNLGSETQFWAPEANFGLAEPILGFGASFWLWGLILGSGTNLEDNFGFWEAAPQPPKPKIGSQSRKTKLLAKPSGPKIGQNWLQSTKLVPKAQRALPDPPGP